MPYRALAYVAADARGRQKQLVLASFGVFNRICSARHNAIWDTLDSLCSYHTSMNPGGNAIALIGFMGAGKSAVGREVSRRIGWPRHDTDEMIRQRFGISIPDIFAQHGEPAFRDAETALLKTLRRGITGIVVTGGGIILRTQNVQLLRGMGRIVWLDADEKVLWQRVSKHSARPLLQTPDPRARFAELLQERLPLYRSAADYRISTSSNSIAQVTDEIIALI
jgi:shikimate kinase